MRTPSFVMHAAGERMKIKWEKAGGEFHAACQETGEEKT